MIPVKYDDIVDGGGTYFYKREDEEYFYKVTSVKPISSDVFELLILRNNSTNTKLPHLYKYLSLQTVNLYSSDVKAVYPNPTQGLNIVTLIIYKYSKNNYIFAPFTAESLWRGRHALYWRRHVLPAMIQAAWHPRREAFVLYEAGMI